MAAVVPWLTKIGVALGFTGTTATVVGSITVASTALSVYSSVAAMRQLKGLKTAESSSGRDITTRSTVEAVKTVYGTALCSGPVTFVHAEDGVLYEQIALTAHEVESITDVYFSNEKIQTSDIDSSGNVTGGTFGPDADGNTIAIIKRYLGTSDQTADSNFTSLSEYPDTSRGRGIAYLSIKCVLTAESQKTWDEQGAPSQVRALVKGKKDIYDPRLDSNYLTNPATTNSSYQAWTDNPALCIADFLMSNLGLAVPASKIDWASIYAAANYCDVSVTQPDSSGASTTGKRFTANGVVWGTDSAKTSLDALCSSCNGTVIYSSGKYYLDVGYSASVLSLDESDLAGPAEVSTAFSRNDRFNTIKATYVSKDENYKRSEMPRAQIASAVTRDNSLVLEKEIHLPFTDTSVEAQRIANKLIQQSDMQTVVTLPLNFTGTNVRPGDRISLTLDEFSWSSKVFVCTQWTYDVNGVQLVLREDSSSAYSDPALSWYSTVSSDGVITPSFPGVPNPTSLTATSVIDGIELNWVAPSNSEQFTEISVFASPSSAWASAVKIGQGRMTSFLHDASTEADPLTTAGTTRYYWVRAQRYTGTDASSVSVRNPNNDTSTITASVGTNDPNFSDVVDNIGTLNAPTNLVLTETTTLSNDGTVLPAILAQWTASAGSTASYLSYYNVEYKKTSTNQIDYGGVADAYTSTLDYGSVATTATTEYDYGSVTETVPGASTVWSAFASGDVATTIAGLDPLEEYTVRVRGVTRTGTVSSYLEGTITLQGDQTAPGPPTSVTATGEFQQIELNFTLPSAGDFDRVQILMNTVDNRATATLAMETRNNTAVIAGLPNDELRYFWLRALDRSANASNYTSVVSATTIKIAMSDFTQAVVDEFAAGNAFGIEPVSSLPASGDHTGQVKLLLGSGGSSDTLYVWDGSAWSTQLYTASQTSPGSVTAASFAAGVEPIGTVSSLPTPSGYTGPSIVFLTTDGKLYRYTSGAWTAQVAAPDLSGTLPDGVFSTTNQPVRVVSALTDVSSPVTGQVVYLSTDDKLYRYTGSSWTNSVSAADLNDQVNLNTQVTGELQTINANSALINSNISINSDGTLSGAGSGQVTLTDLGAGTLAAKDTVNLASEVTGILAEASAAAGLKNSGISINADGTLTGASTDGGAVSLSGLNAGALATLDTISETLIDDNAITTGKIAASAIEASKINVNEVFADEAVVGKIVTESVTAVNIKTVLVSTNRLSADQILANTITATEIAAGTITSDQIQARSILAGDLVAGTLTASEMNVSSLFADEGVIGQLRTSLLTADFITVGIGDFEFITANNLFANSVTTAAIATDSVTANEISVTNLAAISADLGTITAGSIQAGIISGGTLNTARLNIDGVTLSSDGAGKLIIKSGGVDTGQLKNSAVTTDKVNDNAINADKISVTSLSAISADMGTITAGSIQAELITAGTLSASRLNIDGVTLENDGGQLIIKGGGVDTTQLADGAVTDVKIGSLSADKINTGSLSADYIQIDDVTLDTDGSGNLIIKTDGVGSTQLATDSVGSDQIANNGVGTNQLADNAVTDAKVSALDASSITTGQLAAARIDVDTLQVKYFADATAKIYNHADNAVPLTVYGQGTYVPTSGLTSNRAYGSYATTTVSEVRSGGRYIALLNGIFGDCNGFTLQVKNGSGSWVTAAGGPTTISLNFGTYRPNTYVYSGTTSLSGSDETVSFRLKGTNSSNHWYEVYLSAWVWNSG